MAKNENRQFVGLKCSRCGKLIRPTSKNKKNTPDKLEMKKESNAYSKGFLKGSCIIVACLVLGFFLAYLLVR